MSYEFPKCLMAISPMNGRHPGGFIGDQIIKVPIEYVLSLHQMHPEVQVVKAVTPPPPREYVYECPKDHVPQPRTPSADSREYLYLHIRSRYAFQCPPGAPMMMEDFTAFLERYHKLWEERV